MWTLHENWAILRNGQHWNDGFADWLRWLGGNIDAYRSDINEWWGATVARWAKVAQ